MAAVMLLAALLLPSAAFARDASFIEPGTSVGKGATNEALVAEPKEVDTGESVVGVARRITLFFSNQSNTGVTIRDMTVNGDGNVTTEITSDDCKKVGKIPAFTRCAVVMSITPSSPGPWTVEILVTHDGLGRIARATVNGMTLGERKESQEKKMGLALNNQKTDPIDFGEVEIGVGKPVRSALIYNDSNEDITIISIDLIAASNGLARLNQGCEVDMTLRPGESCPITLQWTPFRRNTISTDLIVRHSGRVGFMVVQVRGKTTGEAMAGAEGEGAEGNMTRIPGLPPPPPSAAELGNLMNNVPPVNAGALSGPPPMASQSSSAPVHADIYLVGTVGKRAILQRGGGATKVVAEGSEGNVGGVSVRVISVNPRAASVEMNGETHELKLGGSPYRPSQKEAAPSSVSQATPAVIAPISKPAQSTPVEEGAK
ncbi:MAG: hypothetical protein GC131_08040 [Alphaproteobacteria bacterium]|nr:hypothetical protein [Alphaproteobacteria bacterium]